MPNIADFHLSKGPAMALNPPAGTYKTKDGWFAISIVKEQNFADLCRVMGIEEAISDERFKTSEKRADNIALITEIIQGKLKNKTTEYWDGAFKQAGLLANSVNDFGDWLNDEHVKEIEGYSIVEQPEAVSYTHLTLPTTPYV